ncbi:MAG TPA: sigma-70 family RNA polymerase sigma factor [Gemmataceae bacterium]
MSQTSISLLERLRLHSESADWNRLVELYTPLIRRWLFRHDVPAADADDLTQDVLGVVVRELVDFQHNQRLGAFRAWLRAITVNRLRGYWRGRQHSPQAAGNSEVARQLEELEDPHSSLSQLWDQEHDRHVLGRLMNLIEPEFPLTWWHAFRRHVVEGARASQVAKELDVSVNVVLLAKSRILRRLRQEAAGFVDEALIS